MRPLPAVVADEVVNKCVADHHMPPDPDYSGGHVSIVDTARIVDVKPGHAPHDPVTGICPTCGRIAYGSDRLKALGGSLVYRGPLCAERADWVVELRYHVVHEPATRYSPERRDVEYGALYGVTVQGDALDVACWMD